MNPLSIAILMALHEEVGVSTTVRVSSTSITRHFPENMRQSCQRVLEELVKAGLIEKHPTKEQTTESNTYSLTVRGVSKIREILHYIT